MDWITQFSINHCSFENIKESKAYKLRSKLNDGGKLTREEKDWVTYKVNYNEYFFKDSIPLRGWRFDFSDVLRVFIVKQYGRWDEYRAMDKTSLRRLLHGRIDNIIEVA